MSTSASTAAEYRTSIGARLRQMPDATTSVAIAAMP
jgi:hypothetical protein